MSVRVFFLGGSIEKGGANNMRKPRQLKLSGSIAGHVIKQWDNYSIKKLVNFVNCHKPCPNATEIDIIRFGRSINSALPGLCKPKAEVK